VKTIFLIKEKFPFKQVTTTGMQTVSSRKVFGRTKIAWKLPSRAQVSQKNSKSEKLQKNSPKSLKIAWEFPSRARVSQNSKPAKLQKKF
jgi:hypothetical protein